MILILTASIMYWSLQQPAEESESCPAEDGNIPDASPAASVDGESETPLDGEVCNLAINDAASDTAPSDTAPEVENEESPDKVEGKD